MTSLHYISPLWLPVVFEDDWGDYELKSDTCSLSAEYLRPGTIPAEKDEIEILRRYGEVYEEEKEYIPGRPIRLRFIKFHGDYWQLHEKFKNLTYGELLKLVDSGDKDAINYYKDDRIQCRTIIDFLWSKIDPSIEKNKEWKPYIGLFYQKGKIFYRNRWRSRLEDRYKNRKREYIGHCENLGLPIPRDFMFIMYREIIPSAAFLGWTDFEREYESIITRKFDGYLDKDREPDKYRIKYKIEDNRPESLPIRRIGEMDLLDGATSDSLESRYKEPLYEETDEYDTEFIGTPEGELNFSEVKEQLIDHLVCVEARQLQKEYQFIKGAGNRIPPPFPEWLDGVSKEDRRLLLSSGLDARERKQKERLIKRLYKNPDPRKDVRWKKKKRKYPINEPPDWAREYKCREKEENMQLFKPALIPQTDEYRRAYWTKYHAEQNHGGDEETCIYCHNQYNTPWCVTKRP